MDIVNSTGDIRINAVAGSGKTTTVIAYAKARPKTSNILYLAFNKSVKLEAQRKFAEHGLDNVKVETAHSLAYKHVVFKHGYTVRQQAYKTHEIAEMLGLQGNGEKHAEHIVANHINKFIAYFCNSDVRKVSELNYRDVVTDAKAKAFVSTHYAYIERQTRLLLKKMDDGEIEIPHDFYLKKFQLSNPRLHFDFILFDEGQDASPAMLDVFLNQPATKVIVGDTHQQIYGWRFAVNSLEKAKFKTYQLSTSFRFGQDVADLATNVLAWKNHLQPLKHVEINGKGKTQTDKTKATLARTNLGLLLKAIEFVTEKKNVKHLYFEGNFNSYTYADDGASLYDVLHLYNARHGSIKDKLIKGMRDLTELEDYIEKTEDAQLKMMVEIVLEYGNDIPRILKSIKDKHVVDDQKDKAEMIFSTVHRCKGMEYDVVHLVSDFVNEEKLKKSKNDAEANPSRLNEEINLLYVAVTRARNTLFIPEALMPKDFPASTHIHVVKPVKEDDKKKSSPETGKRKSTTDKSSKEKSYTVESKRQSNKAAYAPWTDALDKELTTMFCEGVGVKEMVAHFGRTKGAIESRIKKLELFDLYGI